MDRLRIGQLTAGSLFKIGYFCLLGICLPFGILTGLMAMGGTDAVQINGRYVHGVEGLIAGIAIGVIFPAIAAGFMVLGGLVMRMFSKILPGLTLRGDRQVG